jgi:hypothetical protein
MHYRLLEPRDTIASAILRETLTHLKHLPDMQADLAKLDTNCCSAETNLRPGQAPPPVILAKALQGPEIALRARGMQETP